MILVFITPVKSGTCDSHHIIVNTVKLIIECLDALFNGCTAVCDRSCKHCIVCVAASVSAKSGIFSAGTLKSSHAACALFKFREHYFLHCLLVLGNKSCSVRIGKVLDIIKSLFKRCIKEAVILLLNKIIERFCSFLIAVVGRSKAELCPRLLIIAHQVVVSVEVLNELNILLCIFNRVERIDIKDKEHL